MRKLAPHQLRPGDRSLPAREVLELDLELLQPVLATLDTGRVELAELVGENRGGPAVVDQVMLDLDQDPAPLAEPHQGPAHQRRLAGVDLRPDQLSHEGG